MARPSRTSMKIRTAVTVQVKDKYLAPGVCEMPAEIAEDLVSRGFAEPVRDAPLRDTAGGDAANEGDAEK